MLYETRDELYVSDSLGRILVVDVRTGELNEIKEFFKMSIFSICLSPNESYLAIMYSSGCCHVISSHTFDVALDLVKHECDPSSFSRDIR